MSCLEYYVRSHSELLKNHVLHMPQIRLHISNHATCVMNCKSFEVRHHDIYNLCMLQYRVGQM